MAVADKIFEASEQALLFVQTTWDTMTVSTAVLAVLTIALTYYTRVLAKEARNTRQQSLEPNIVVTIEPSDLAEFYAFLIIENVGSGVAYDVQINESGNHTFKDSKKEFVLNDLAFMNLKILKVNQKIEHLLGNFKDLPGKVFEFDVTAKDANGRIVKCSNTVDVNCYYDRRGFKNKNMDDLVRQIEKIEKNFGHIITGFSRLKVDSYNQEDRDEQRAERERIFQEQRAQSEAQNENEQTSTG